jgi:FKBP-type peptidyl-prolyl cis-trans isomerase
MMASKLYRTSTSAAALALATLLGGCGDGPTGPQVIGDVEFAASLGIDLDRMTKTASGVYIEDVTEGTGDPIQSGAVINIAYTGWLTDGVPFDSGQFSFTLGESGFIEGWNLGIEGMKLGGRRLIVIPPELGYGDAGRAVIPGGSILIFRIDLLTVS